MQLLCANLSTNSGGAVFTGSVPVARAASGPFILPTDATTCPGAQGPGPGGYGLHGRDQDGNRLPMQTAPEAGSCSVLVRVGGLPVAMIGTMTTCGHAMATSGTNLVARTAA